MFLKGNNLLKTVNTDMINMPRNEFIRKVVRLLLLGLLGGIALLTGGRIAEGSSCTACPGKGICAGRTDCSTFLQK
jgi:hypothetical protein